MATAIFTSRMSPGRSVIVFDGAKKLGAKILISGGGRCNLTNRTVTADDFCGGSRNVIRHVLTAFPVEPTLAFFREIGVEVHEEEHGKLFPKSNRASTVLKALLREADRLGVHILPEHRVNEVRRNAAGFAIHVDDRTWRAARVVLATGGKSFPKTGSDGFGFRLAHELGHSVIPPTPALAPLKLKGDFHGPLSGISHDVELTLEAAGWKPVHTHGAILWTHFGVSGPVALNMSRHWHRASEEQRDVSLAANFVSPDDVPSVESRLLALTSTNPRLQLHNALGHLIPARVADRVLDSLGVEKTTIMAQLPKPVRHKLAQALVHWPLSVSGSRGYGHAEATAGGVPLSEVTARTVESRKCPGLHFVGEILDVDGRIGGFNFQWAWSSAWVVASALAKAAKPGAPTTE